MHTALNKMRALMAADALADYPDHNKQFDMHLITNYEVLALYKKQEGQPVAYNSCELSKSQQNYTVMEKEMLSIVATLDEF
ncbi:hypothetical protein ACHAW6_006269 [Cyclotella cf. meneghiniana]